MLVKFTFLPSGQPTKDASDKQRALTGTNAVIGTAFPEPMSAPATASSLWRGSRAGLSMRFGDRVEDRSASYPLALCCAADTVPSASGSGLCSSNESSQLGFRLDGLSLGRVDDYGCSSHYEKSALGIASERCPPRAAPCPDAAAVPRDRWMAKALGPGKPVASSSGYRWAPDGRSSNEEYLPVPHDGTFEPSQSTACTRTHL